MTSPSFQEQFISLFKESFSKNTFVNMTLGHYTGDEADLKNINIKKIQIKGVDKLNFTFRYKTRDITKNYSHEESVDLLSDYLNNGFLSSTLFTTENDFIYDVLPNGKARIKKNAPTKSDVPVSGNDKVKKRLISAENKGYLFDLNITDANGQVFKNAQDKYRQINHYIELLSPLIKELPERENINVADMGSGKGYLTFALYDYLNNVAQQPATVHGVEYREDMVELCNKIAAKSHFDQLSFVQGTIQDYDASDINVLIALHACDTATDDAIAKGITAGADLIVVAPCCHKQIRREIEKSKTSNDVNFLTRYGVFMERQAEMVTDGIRALVLEYFGYKTKIFEFISDAHTPKNVMITAVKTKNQDRSKEKIKDKITQAKSYFGISYHHLERILHI